MTTLEQLQAGKRTLQWVIDGYRNGRISREVTTAYIRLWNAGPHFTQAVIAPDGHVRTFYADMPNYPHLHAEFGVRTFKETSE